MDECLNEILVAVLKLKEVANAENVGQDDMETALITTLSAAGVEFKR